MKIYRTKNTFIILTAAIMILDTSMVSRAAGWTETEYGWHYEENGEYIKSAWKKGEKGYYYLGESGKLSTAAWISHGDEKYYVDSDGLRVKNTWINTERWDDFSDKNQYWYYFDRNGEMMTGKQQIGDKKYFFSDTGEMLTGWITYTDGEAAKLTDEISSNYTYYCLEDGTRASGWLKLAPPSDEESTGAEYWYNFRSDGKIRRNTTVTIGDHEYCFDTEGRMMDGWVYNTGDTYEKVDDQTDRALLDKYNEDVSKYIYCGTENVGVIQKDIWLSIVPPGLNGDPDEDEYWYYFNKKGKITTASKGSVSLATQSNASRTTEVRAVDTKGKYGLSGGDDDLTYVQLVTIKDEQYLFNSKGTLVDGLIYIYNKDGSFPLKEGYYYFGSKSAKSTGKVILKNDGTEYEYYFSKKRENGYSQGQGISGIFNGKLYYKGLAVTAEEELKYKLVYIPEFSGDHGTGLFLVDENGKVKTGGLTSESETGYRYRIIKNTNNSSSGFRIYRVEKGMEDEELSEEDADLKLDISEPELIL